MGLSHLFTYIIIVGIIVPESSSRVKEAINLLDYPVNMLLYRMGGNIAMSKVKNTAKNIKSFLFKHKIISVILIIIIGIGIYFLRPKTGKPVSTETVTRKEFTQSLSITGTITAEKEVNLTFPISGTIAQLPIKKGDHVEQGSVIATLDQRTALKNLQSTLISYSLQRDTFDQTQDNYQNRRPYQALNDSMRRILQDNQFNLDKAVVSVELQDLAKQQSVLTTPISGIVTKTDAKNAGVTAIAGTTGFTITDPSSLEFKMEVDEADIAKIKEGQKVTVNLDPYPDKTLYLTVKFIDFVTHTTSTGGNAYDVKAILPETKGFDFRVGMNGNAEIILTKKQNVLAIPLSSLVEDNKVYVKTNNKFVKKTLKLGLQNDTSTEILSGLSEGDVIASDPTLVPGNKSK